MKPRERVVKAINLKEPDRIPLDFGGTTVSSINLEAYEKMKKLEGFENQTTVFSFRSKLAFIEEEILRKYGVDTRNASKGDISKPQMIDQNQRSYTDEWGVVWERASNGPYINKEGPFSKRDDPEVSDLSHHKWPDPSKLAQVSSTQINKAKRYHQQGFAVMAGLPVRTLSQAQRLRGFDKWLVDCIRRPKFAEALIDKSVEIGLEATEIMLESLGDYLDVVFWTDDLGSSRGPLIDPELYRQLVKPYQKKIVEKVKANTEIKVLLHTDGCIYPLIPDIIEIGVDPLNPIQHNLGNIPDMDPGDLKQEFGEALAFWGGIDTSQVLPRGDPADVKEEVRRRIDQLGSGGGYVVSSVHNIQSEVPPENVRAMLEAVREYGVY